MNTLSNMKTRLTNLSLVTAAVAALAMGAMNASPAGAVPMDEPWGEPPTCSNVTFDCTSIADQLAYECSFVDTSGMTWCETELPDLLEMEVEPTRENTLTTRPSTPPPPTAKVLVAR